MVVTLVEQVLGKKEKNLYRFFVGKQFLPDLVKVLSILPQSFDKLFLKRKKSNYYNVCLKPQKKTTTYTSSKRRSELKLFSLHRQNVCV